MMKIIMKLQRRHKSMQVADGNRASEVMSSVDGLGALAYFTPLGMLDPYLR